MKPSKVFLTCTSIALIFGIVSSELARAIFDKSIFGPIFRVPAHHEHHPYEFWILQCLTFGLFATAWWQTFSRARFFVRIFTALMAIWISILFAAFPASLLWMHYEFGLSELSSRRIFELFPYGIEAGVLLCLTSIPFNLVAVAFGIALMMWIPVSVPLDQARKSSGGALAYFRTATSKSNAWNLAKTLFQTTIFWFSFLYLVPQILLVFERLFRLKPFEFFGQTGMASAGFVLASFGGLWSGATMAVRGKGTPLPFDTAARLVVAGPYKYVRNPMAIFGLAQGLFVGIYLGSYFIFPYVFLGAWLWNTYVRPVEETELRIRFGSAYEEYCQRVACWRFRIGK